MGNIESDLSATAAEIETALARHLSACAPAGGRLVEAMRHAALGGGKRLRPFVMIASAELFGVPRADALPAACALELVHCYSLVHDDLPAMDDDDLRRGRPTVHRAFDEATAILAGDALLTLAFEIVAAPACHPDPAVRAALTVELARSAGASGMAEGQMRDLAAEGRFAPDGRPLSLCEADVSALQGLKTGALFRYAALSGAILADAPLADRDRMARYGTALGRAFQIADDLLDEESSAEELGKATAKDRARGKATLPGAIGATAARERLAGAVAQARDLLGPYGMRAARLRSAAEFAAMRRK